MTDSVRYRPAYVADIPAITDLWHSVFGDSTQAIQQFYQAFPQCRAVVAENGAGELVAVVHVLPQTLALGQGTLPAAYVYAVATRPDYRGRGICRGLMAFCEALLARLGYALAVLTPAEPSLFGYYGSMGYETAFFRQRTPFAGGREITPAAYLQKRKALLTGPHMVYDLAFLAYLQAAYGLRFYETDDGIAAAADGYTGEVLPQDLGGAPYAMAKWLIPPRPFPPGYLGFALE